jgi:hypothetical protein
MRAQVATAREVERLAGEQPGTRRPGGMRRHRPTPWAADRVEQRPTGGVDQLRPWHQVAAQEGAVFVEPGRPTGGPAGLGTIERPDAGAILKVAGLRRAGADRAVAQAAFRRRALAISQRHPGVVVMESA